MDIFTTQTSFFISLALLAFGASSALALGKSDMTANLLGNLSAALAAVFGLVSSASVITSGTTFFYSVASSLPLLALSFSVDRLSAFFIFVISLIALFTSVYALGYVRHYYGPYSIGTLGF